MKPSLDLRDERFYSWNVRVDRALSERYWLHKGSRSRSCGCVWCANWRAAVDAHLPMSLKLALRRLGVRATRERDVYQQAADDQKVLYRAEYTCIGEIASGPQFWVLKDRGWHLFPRELRQWPWYLAVGVTTREGHQTPLARHAIPIPSFALELRVALPWVLPQKMPAVASN